MERIVTTVIALAVLELAHVHSILELLSVVYISVDMHLQQHTLPTVITLMVQTTGLVVGVVVQISTVWP